jgi:aspartate ammonia-lyase
MRNELDSQGKTATLDVVLPGIAGDGAGKYPTLIRAVARIKKACAMANRDIAALAPEKADAIMQACDAVMDGKFADHFPMSIYGDAASLNGAANGALARCADEILAGGGNSGAVGSVDPDAHVNLCGSAVEVISTAKGFVVHEELGKLIHAAEVFADGLDVKAEECRDVVKTGRLYLRDAGPVTLGQEFAAYASGIRRMIRRLTEERGRWSVHFMGSGVLGTCPDSLSAFRVAVGVALSRVLGREIRDAENAMDARQAMDGIILAHAHIQASAALVWKVARDIRIMTSGPRAGFAEIVIPPVQPGSSIMPGKVNPVIPEMVLLTCDQVSANHAGLNFAAHSGYLESGSSSALPVKAVMDSADLLSRTMIIFTEKCINGIRANRDRLPREEEHLCGLKHPAV